jgi:hypothetical protein
MPYTIFIPAFYQSRFYTLPPNYTTSASSISLPTSCPLSHAIYTSAREWGLARSPPTRLPPDEWVAYAKKAKRLGWYDDVWRIWQRETGLRIRERDGDVVGSGKGCRKAVGRWVYKWVVVREGVRAGFREDIGEERTEGKMVAREDVEIESLAGSLVERLEGLEVDRRRRRRLASDERTCSIDDLDMDLLSRQQISVTPARRGSA